MNNNNYSFNDMITWRWKKIYTIILYKKTCDHFYVTNDITVIVIIIKYSVILIRTNISLCVNMLYYFRIL